MNELLDEWFKFWGREINVIGSLLIAIPYAFFAILRWIVTGKSPLPALAIFGTPHGLFATTSAILVCVFVSFLSSNLPLLIVVIPLLLCLAGQLAVRRWVRNQTRAAHAAVVRIHDRANPPAA
jgi:hypothetical protein